VWEITLACDLGCKHCGSRAGKARPTELSTAECLEVVHQMSEMGIREVTLIGGEAYLRDDWDVIAAEITKMGMTCGMTTGARNLTQDRVDRAVDAGLRTISISLDGLEHTHDAQRGVKGSWRNALAAAERVAASPIRLATNSQVNRLSLPEFAAMGQMLADIGSKAWQIQLTVAMGRAADRPDLLLQPYDLLELFPLLVWIKEQRLVPNGVTLFPGNNIGYFGPYESTLRFGGERGAHWQSCSAGKWSIGLEADGKIKGCPSLTSADWTGGNLRDDRLAHVVQNAPELTFLKNRTRDDLWGFCKSCYYADVCKAGCTWTSQVLFGKSGNNPYCIHRAIEHQKEGKRERVEKRSAAPGQPFDHGIFEIVLEDIPEGASAELPATIGGVPVEDVVNLDWRAGSVWPKEMLQETLMRSVLSR
jgi:radical SAM protein with 4Fe4S-binding SPASM domain